MMHTEDVPFQFLSWDVNLHFSLAIWVAGTGIPQFFCPNSGLVLFSHFWEICKWFVDLLS
jgi:hypothetical protein